MACPPSDAFRKPRRVAEAKLQAAFNEMQGGRTWGFPEAAPPRGEGLHLTCYTGGAVRFEDVFSFGNLYEAGKACCNGVRWKASTQMFEANLLQWAANIHRQLFDGTYRSRGFNRFTICERGKVRHIQAIHISERMVQKCLVRNCLRPLILPKLISDTYATLPGKGTEAAIERLCGHLRRHYRMYGAKGYVVVMDYHDFFSSIEHNRLKAMYRRLRMDDRLLGLCDYFVDQFPGESGLGLGSEISQVSAVYYLSPIDHWAKDRMRACYGRYMDDSYAVFPTLEEAREFLVGMREVSEAMGLQLNESTHIAPISQGFNYLKRRVHIANGGRVYLRPTRKNVTRALRRTRRNGRLLKGGAMSVESEAASSQSTMAYYDTMDAHYTSIEIMRARTS